MQRIPRMNPQQEADPMPPTVLPTADVSDCTNIGVFLIATVVIAACFWLAERRMATSISADGNGARTAHVGYNESRMVVLPSPFTTVIKVVTRNRNNSASVRSRQNSPRATTPDSFPLTRNLHR